MSAFERVLITIILLVSVVCIKSHNIYAQSIIGQIIDQNSNDPLAYVHIGIRDKGIGCISDENGNFSLDVSTASTSDSITISMIGYVEQTIPIKNNMSKKLLLHMKQRIHNTQEVLINSSRIVRKNRKPKVIGRKKAGSNLTGGSGTGFGGEFGLKIRTGKKLVKLSDINFYLDTLRHDSLLIRVNIYSIKNDLPFRSLLQNDLLLTCYKGESLITRNLEEFNIYLSENVIITLEVIKGWNSGKGSRGVFFRNGAIFYPSKTYITGTSQDKWRKISDPRLALYVTVQPYKEY